MLNIIARSVDQGRMAGIVSVLGIGLGTLVHIVAATLEVSALLVTSALTFNLGLIFFVMGFFCDGLYALIAGSAGRWLKGNALFLRTQRYFSGTVFIGLGFTAALTGSAKT